MDSVDANTTCTTLPRVAPSAIRMPFIGLSRRCRKRRITCPAAASAKPQGARSREERRPKRPKAYASWFESTAPSRAVCPNTCFRDQQRFTSARTRFRAPGARIVYGPGFAWPIHIARERQDKSPVFKRACAPSSRASARCRTCIPTCRCPSPFPKGGLGLSLVDAASCLELRLSANIGEPWFD